MPGASRSATRTSSDAAAPFPDAGGRPCASGARRDDRAATRPCIARRRAGRARAVGRRSATAGQCRSAHVRRIDTRRAAGALRARAGAGATCRRRGRAHDPRLRRARRAARAPAPHSAPSLVHASEGVGAAARGREARDRGPSASTGAGSFDSAKLRPIGHGIDLERAPVPEPRPPTSSYTRSCSGAVHSEGIGPSCAHATGRRDEIEAARCGAATTEAGVAAEELDLGAAARRAVPRARSRHCSRAATCSCDNMEVGAPDKVVYEATAACLPVSRPIPSSTTSSTAPLFFEQRLAREPRRAVALVSVARRRGRPDRAHAARQVARRHSVDTWADGDPGSWRGWGR